jgi:hypothetical protein
LRVWGLQCPPLGLACSQPAQLDVREREQEDRRVCRVGSSASNRHASSGLPARYPSRVTHSSLWLCARPHRAEGILARTREPFSQASELQVTGRKALECLLIKSLSIRSLRTYSHSTLIFPEHNDFIPSVVHSPSASTSNITIQYINILQAVIAASNTADHLGLHRAHGTPPVKT